MKKNTKSRAISCEKTNIVQEKSDPVGITRGLRLFNWLALFRYVSTLLACCAIAKITGHIQEFFRSYRSNASIHNVT
jgi:hypothetical protein